MSGSIKRAAAVPGKDFDYAVIAKVVQTPELYKQLRQSTSWHALTQAQRDNARNVFTNAKKYAADGAPGTVSLSDSSSALWRRIESLCRQQLEKAGLCR